MSDFESGSESEGDESWIPGPRDVSIAFPRIAQSYLDYVEHDVVSVMPKSYESDEDERRDSGATA